MQFTHKLIRSKFTAKGDVETKNGMNLVKMKILNCMALVTRGIQWKLMVGDDVVIMN